MKCYERQILLLMKLMDNIWLRGKLLSRGRSSLVTADNYAVHRYM